MYFQLTKKHSFSGSECRKRNLAIERKRVIIYAIVIIYCHYWFYAQSYVIYKNARLKQPSITKTSQCLGTKKVIQRIKLFKNHEVVKTISKNQEKQTKNFF